MPTKVNLQLTIGGHAFYQLDDSFRVRLTNKPGEPIARLLGLHQVRIGDVFPALLPASYRDNAKKCLFQALEGETVSSEYGDGIGPRLLFLYRPLYANTPAPIGVSVTIGSLLEDGQPTNGANDARANGPTAYGAAAAADLKTEVFKAIIGAQEEERQEIAGELHDNVNQILATCLLYLDVVEKQKAVDLVVECRQLLRTAIDEIRNISHNLMPVDVSYRGFFCSIEDTIDKVNVLGGLQVCLEVQDRDELEKRLAPEVKTASFRIIQEQLSNIIKHSGSNAATIRMHVEDSSFLMTIADNGRGFDPQVAKTGVGLSNIQTRVACYKGTQTLHSAPGEGCSMAIVFPL